MGLMKTHSSLILKYTFIKICYLFYLSLSKQINMHPSINLVRNLMLSSKLKTFKLNESTWIMLVKTVIGFHKYVPELLSPSTFTWIKVIKCLIYSVFILFTNTTCLILLIFDYEIAMCVIVVKTYMMRKE